MASSGGGGEDGLNSINPLSLKSQKVNVAGIEENLDQGQLPAALLVQILSVLPTKDAYTTCFLSKRWRYVWTKVYNFIFTQNLNSMADNCFYTNLELADGLVLPLKGKWKMLYSCPLNILVFAYCLNLSAPVRNLEDLKCWLVDVSSLVNAKLTFYISCIKHKKRDRGDDTGVDEYSCHDYHQGFRILVQDYLQKLSCATELTIGSWFIEVPCMLQFNGLPVPELKCKYLTLELHMENFDLLGVAGLLRALRHVETLNIDMTDNHVTSWSFFLLIVPFVTFEEENTDLRSWISSFVFPNLKNVKIANFFQACLEVDSVSSVDSQKRKRSFDRLVELSELMLKNAMILEKFVIISKRRKCKSCLTNCESKFLLGLAEKLDFQDPPPIQ
ncbi:hypothetical protein P3L10_001000 [Capsicum annuum]